MFITQKEKRRKKIVCVIREMAIDQSTRNTGTIYATWNSFRIYLCIDNLPWAHSCRLLVEESNSSWQTGHCCCCMYSLTSKINSWIVSWIGKKWIEYCTLQVNCTYLRGWVFCFKRLYWLEQFLSIIIVQYQLVYGDRNHLFVRSVIGET